MRCATTRMFRKSTSASRAQAGAERAVPAQTRRRACCSMCVTSTFAMAVCTPYAACRSASRRRGRGRAGRQRRRQVVAATRLARHRAPAGGRVEFDGKDMNGLDRRADGCRAAWCSCRKAGASSPRLTVHENLLMGAFNRRLRGGEARNRGNLRAVSQSRGSPQQRGRRCCRAASSRCWRSAARCWRRPSS